jgi:hypothetical protein
MIVKIWVFFGRKVSQETYILLEIKKKELDEELEARSMEITDETRPRDIGSIFQVHKKLVWFLVSTPQYNYNVLLVVDHTQIA